MATKFPTRPHRADLLVEADRIRAMSDGPLEDSVSLLREARDSRTLAMELQARSVQRRPNVSD